MDRPVSGAVDVPPAQVTIRQPVPGSCQLRFHQRWQHLDDPHVRDLAWLLDAPDLLDLDAAQWGGLIASLPPDAADGAAAWLAELDRAPAVLHDYLALPQFARLGRYAEKLMAFYFQRQGVLEAHGVQVRAGKSDTVGEFDFLLRDGARLLHWEFATKFYLLQTPDVAPVAGHEADYFVGPNLADTLGAKMHKILDRQLALGRHPAAQSHLPQPLSAAQALVKGWLFYHYGDGAPSSASLGVSAAHCRGFWCALSELTEMDRCSATYAILLPRLSWLAPAKVDAARAIPFGAIRDHLARHFVDESMPVMLALLEEGGRSGQLVETARGFIVPDDWRSRAGARIRRSATSSPEIPGLQRA